MVIKQVFGDHSNANQNKEDIFMYLNIQRNIIISMPINSEIGPVEPNLSQWHTLSNKLKMEICIIFKLNLIY